MKKWIVIISSVIIVFLTIISFYFNSDNYIANQNWKYSEGVHIGDWLDKNNIKIEDGIIETVQGKAKILFSFGIKLVIEDIETKKIGFYQNKS